MMHGVAKAIFLDRFHYSSEWNIGFLLYIEIICVCSIMELSELDKFETCPCFLVNVYMVYVTWYVMLN